MVTANIGTIRAFANSPPAVREGKLADQQLQVLQVQGLQRQPVRVVAFRHPQLQVGLVSVVLVMVVLL